MNTQFNGEILNFATIEVLPNAWNDKKYLELLEVLEYGDTSEIDLNDLKDMCMMALTDLEPDEAAKIMLDYVFKDRLNDGQKDNLSHEMLEEKIWEEYADLSMHEEFFNVTQLLYQAYNGKFPHPEAVKFEVKISSKKPEDFSIFKTSTEATLLRFLVKGMPSNTLINRLFNDEIKGESFSQAKDIIWQYKKVSEDKNTMVFEVISSIYWFHDLKFSEPFVAETHSDEKDVDSIQND
ncbi:hypothetical protein [Algibacter sp.]|uniref:hypothetical protein n=1 Tax=Algibacter sp. TaxID=1872428 RepID=UPI003C746276